MSVATAITSRLPRHWTRRAVPWGGGILISVIVAMAMYDIVRSYYETIADAIRELEVQARVIAEQTARSVQAVDVVQRHLADQFRDGRLTSLSSQDLHAELRDQAVALVQVHTLAVFHPTGVLRAGSMFPTVQVPALSISGQAFFETLRADRSVGLFVARSAFQVLDGQWVIPTARRLESSSGEFGGIVAAGIRTNYFERFYRDIRPDQGTKVTLIQQNGSLLARHPPAEAALGKHFPLFDAMVAAHIAGQTRPSSMVSPVDGVERFQAVQLVPEYPLAIVVSRDTTVALAPWRSRSLGTGIRTLALSILAALLLAFLMRKLSRLYEARESLEDSQQRFALAVAGANDGIWDHDLIGRRYFVSARTRELSGVPPGPEVMQTDEWLAKLAATIHPEDEPRRIAARTAHLAGETPTYHCELRHLHPDGNYRWVRLQGLCLRDATGKPYRMAGSVSDIDARKRAEEALRESEERFALAVAGSDDGIWDYDFTAGRVFNSARARELAGMPPGPEMQSIEEWRALISRHLHPDDAPRRAAAMEAHLAGKTPAYECEVRLRDPDGVFRWVRIRGLCQRDAAGNPYRMAGSVTDIDARKGAEEALRQSEERFALAVAGSNDGILDWDIVNDRMYSSDRAMRIAGVESNVTVRTRGEWTALLKIHPDDMQRHDDDFRRHLEGHEALREGEYRIFHADGSLRWIRVRGMSVRDAENRAIRWAGSVSDITDQKSIEADRVRLEGQLLQAKKLEAIGTLAGGIAHDFNNILAAILGNGELAQMDAPEGTSLRRHIDATVSAGMRAKSLVERILAFSRSGIGERIPVHVQSVVGEALDLVAAALPAHVHLERNLTVDDAAIMGDPTQIHQVVMNLCTNAVQAMKSNGTLSVSLDLVEKGQSMAATGTLKAGRYIRLRVTDTGAGIPAHVLERIFDPFFTTKEVGVGTGLGLSLVHGIVTDLGGGIEVESRVGAGTTFFIYLPSAGAAAAAVATEDEPIATGTGETILLVDDEEVLIQLGEELIAKLGYEPVGFTSSTAALQEFRDAPDRFHAVLSDESMPNMTGSELAREIRMIRPDMPIVLMSGFVSPVLAARAREIGVMEVLPKPLVARDIARSLACALRGA